MNSGFGEVTTINPFAAAVQWLSGTLLGSVATAVAVIAVASFGVLLLSGRIDMRRGARMIFGCFILFGASSIAVGIMRASERTPSAVEQSAPLPPTYPNAPVAAASASSTYDPYAGAAMPAR